VHDEMESTKGKRIVRVEDLATTVRLKKVQAAADASVRKMEAAAKLEEAKLELHKLKLGMTSREAASRHLAHFAGLYMFLCVIAFLFAVRTLEGELVAVTAGLITLVVTTIGGLLRSIVSEGNGGESSEPRAKK
jgi:hypothetical protein